jgi:membrane glycosyltransferase
MKSSLNLVVDLDVFWRLSLDFVVATIEFWYIIATICWDGKLFDADDEHLHYGNLMELHGYCTVYSVSINVIWYVLGIGNYMLELSIFQWLSPFSISFTLSCATNLGLSIYVYDETKTYVF